MHIHILGIGGTFMGGVAQLARAAGHRVTGCDSAIYPPMSKQLEAAEIEVIEGYDAAQTAFEPDCYLVGNAIARGNPLPVSYTHLDVYKRQPSSPAAQLPV